MINSVLCNVATLKKIFNTNFYTAKKRTSTSKLIKFTFSVGYEVDLSVDSTYWLNYFVFIDSCVLILVGMNFPYELSNYRDFNMR